MELNMRISAYLPAIVRRHLEASEHIKDKSPPKSSSAADDAAVVDMSDLPDTHSATVVSMFADVSGFTALTETLATRGPTGAEYLAKHLNSYFEQLLKLISSEGGDAFKFAGDALIAFWPQNKEDTLESLVRRCIQCALRIQQHLHKAHLAEYVELSIKMGIGVGRVTIAHLGGESDGATRRMEYVGFGSALSQAFHAEHHATTGDVVCSADCWQLVSSHFHGDVVSAGAACVRVTEVLHPLARQSRRASLTRDDVHLQRRMQKYVSRAVWPYLDTAEEFWGSELRDVTVLFINLGFGEDDLSAILDVTGLRRLNKAFKAVQRCIYDYEGTINKFLVDDKGSTAIAVFGMPPVTHENDPIRGVLSSLAIYAALAPLGLKASVGITTGTAFCGVVGHQGNRREYTVLGDMVNLAARLMQKAKSENGGGVITDDRTKLSTQDVLHFEDRPEIWVKGKHEGVKIHRPYAKMSVLVHHLKGIQGNAASTGATTFKTKENMHSIQVHAARHRLRTMAALPPLDDASIPENPSAKAIQEALWAKIDQMNVLSPTGALLLEGDIGLGKTRLVRSTLRRVSPVVKVVYATATPYSAGQHYVIFADALATCCGDAPMGPQVAEWIRQGVPPGTPWLDHLHVLNSILDDVAFAKPSNQDVDAPQEMASWFVSLLATDLMDENDDDHGNQDAETAASRRRPKALSKDERDSLWCPTDLDVAGMLILTALYGITREQPLVLCLDNAMYMDEKSWILAISMAKYFTNCVVVVVLRPPSVLREGTASGCFRKQLRALKDLESTTRCVMDRMQPAQIEELALAILKVQTLPDDLASVLVSRSQGNPLFLHELIKEMSDQEVLKVDNKTNSCETRVQLAWGDKAHAMFCFGCQAKLQSSKERTRCKACGYVFCAACTPKQCIKKLASQPANDQLLQHCKTCFNMSRARRPSFERSLSDSKCLTGSGSGGSSVGGPEKRPTHRKVLSLFVQPSDASPLKHRLALVAPRTIKSVLTTLLDQLTVSQCMLMKTASIVASSGSFDVDTVKGVYPIKDHLARFQRDLDELERLSMVQPVDVFIGGLGTHRSSKFEFCHGFMQDVIRSQMLSVQCDKLASRLVDFRELKDKAMRQQYFERSQGVATQPLAVVLPPPAAERCNSAPLQGSLNRINLLAPRASSIQDPPALATVLRLKAGMVHVKKQSGVLRALRLGKVTMWKKRWAVLHNTRLLLQYDTNRGGRFTWMELKGARVSTCDMTHDPAGFKYHCLQVEVQEWCRMPQPESLSPRTFILGVDSEREMENWIYMIKYAIESHKNR
ncbi:Aste57867_19187 [Aphanomyces stellatus]|uniref:Aste57867_19187 protein n=1 Tax=Aphanomyces stellatus TaxID=120398 RepID=A0A485LBZ0_9STRA|nr:hypothetical protein As57867_019123 [Aphanomyces stellatus]VFT95909.1 Aste57867_19187 [Aphanomyces stellatus]